MDTTEVIGHIGSALSSLTFIPQVVHTWKTKSVKDLNLFISKLNYVINYHHYQHQLVQAYL